MKGFHFTIIQVGKTKEKYLQEAENEQLYRLRFYAKIDRKGVKDIKTPKTPQNGDIERTKALEGQNILKIVPEGSFVVALDEKGRQFTSPEFATFLGKKRYQEGKHMTFIIGGCYGLDRSVLERAELVLSFSKFTFTHEMIRPLLYEQLYRCMTLLEGKKYHY